MHYESFRHFADSWALAAMVVVFVAVVAFAFRRGSRQVYDDAANIPFKGED